MRFFLFALLVISVFFYKRSACISTLPSPARQLDTALTVGSLRCLSGSQTDGYISSLIM